MTELRNLVLLLATWHLDQSILHRTWHLRFRLSSVLDTLMFSKILIYWRRSGIRSSHRNFNQNTPITAFSVSESSWYTACSGGPEGLAWSKEEGSHETRSLISRDKMLNKKLWLTELKGAQFSGRFRYISNDNQASGKCGLHRPACSSWMISLNGQTLRCYQVTDREQAWVNWAWKWPISSYKI